MVVLTVLESYVVHEDHSPLAKMLIPGVCELTSESPVTPTSVVDCEVQSTILVRLIKDEVSLNLRFVPGFDADVS